ncbi:hypothetical protein Q4561_12865 [Alteromonas sp. 1_MG-2023]|uniref:hypothetical protein n=1 Tax=Alteromonas sp. 1_MG-2023 TaxID=3062669 RepID=UPI0026E41404|nr:hypothetical protein [Alteromonas sp. 1_MG-2023]MDO6567956.1 hypothetical protein [Alteromonas sp. 1_MG-2023]
MLRMNSVFSAFLLLSTLISASSFAQSASKLINAVDASLYTNAQANTQANTQPNNQDQAVAMLFGKPITLTDINPDKDVISDLRRQAPDNYKLLITQLRAIELTNQIIEAVLDDYATANNIQIDSSLVERFKQNFGAEYEEKSQAASSAEEKVSSTTEKAEPKSIDDVASTQVKRWQIEKHLYSKYGGAVVFEQSNPSMPVAAYLAVMKEYDSKGKFKILNATFAPRFWEAFEPPYDFPIPAESVDFSQPWWL